MDAGRRFASTTVLLGILALGHAGFTMPPAATLAIFGGGAVIAFVGEAIVIGRGWLRHHIHPQLHGVPIYVVFGWTAVTYAAIRLALLVTSGWLVPFLAAALATGYDMLADHRGVMAGFWTYTDTLPGPRPRGVPWWNFGGWAVITFLTASLALPFM